MITKISDVIARWLQKSNVICNDDVELYSYAVHSLLLVSAPIVMTSIIGIIMKMLLQSIMFILPFVLIRKFSGGFHLKSPTTCVFVSMGILTLFIAYIKLSFQYKMYLFTITAAFISSIILIVNSPIDSEERKLSDREKRVFGIIAKIMTIVFLSVIIILAVFRIFDFAIPISCGIILSGSLQIPCCILRIIHNQLQKNNKVL